MFYVISVAAFMSLSSFRILSLSKYVSSQVEMNIDLGQTLTFISEIVKGGGSPHDFYPSFLMAFRTISESSP